MSGQVIAVVAVAILVAALAGLSLYRRRRFVAKELSFRVSVVIVYAAVFLLGLHYTDPPKALLIALLVMAVLSVRWRPRHSRYVSRRDRRKVIARFERSGERYDPKKHEIDHVVPHSRGGVSRADNLRVIARARNRSKSAKVPWWDVLGK
jgi:uncharacterized membrane protein YfcA